MKLEVIKRPRGKQLLIGLMATSGLLGATASQATNYSDTSGNTEPKQLISAKHDQCLVQDGSYVRVEDCVSEEDEQVWKYNPQNKSLLSDSGKCIDGGYWKGYVKLKSCNGYRTQSWTYDESKQVYRNGYSGLCLDIYYGSKNGKVGTWHCHGEDNQIWTEYSKPVTPPPPPPPIEEAKALQNNAHSQCLNSTDGTSVNVRDCDITIDTQLWRYSDTSKMLYTSSGECVEATASRSHVTQTACSNESNQKWEYNDQNSTLVSESTGECLDVWGGERDNEVGIWTCDNSTRQEWNFTDLTTPPEPTEPSTNIRNLTHGQCVNSINNIVNTADCDTTVPAQQWVFDSTTHALIDHQGKCIDATTPSAPTVLNNCNGSAAQQWAYDSSTKNYTNAANNQCLDLWGGLSGNEIAVWACDGSIRQVFEDFPPVVTPPTGDGSWESMGLMFNDRAVAVDNTGSRIFFSLADGFETAADWTANTSYLETSPFTLKAQGKSLTNGAATTLTGIQYGSEVTLQRFEDGTLKDEYTLVFTNLPVIQLTSGLILDEPKTEGTFQLSSGHFAENTDTFKMGIEFRGETSQAFPKKNFSLQLGEDDDWTDELKTTLLDLRKDGDWILDAAFRDTTQVRNLVNHDIFRELQPQVYFDADNEPQGQSSIRGHLVEVILNGGYHGLYVLSEKVDRKLLGLEKVDVPEDADGNELWNEVDFSLPSNSSILFKADYSEASFLDPNNYRIGFEQKYPDVDDIVRWEPLDEFAALITETTDAEFVAQIGSVIDMDSFVNFWALVLAGQAQDNTQKNHYYSRNEGGKIVITTWDFDATFGMFWNGAEDSSVTWFFPTNDNRLFQRLITLPETGFNAKLKARWTELRGSIFTPDLLAARFQQYIDEATLGNARQRNLVRWPESGNLGAGNPALGTSEYIRSLLVQRLTFVDDQIANLP